MRAYVHISDKEVVHDWWARYNARHDAEDYARQWCSCSKPTRDRKYLGHWLCRNCTKPMRGSGPRSHRERRMTAPPLEPSAERHAGRGRSGVFVRESATGRLVVDLPASHLRRGDRSWGWTCEGVDRTKNGRRIRVRLRRHADGRVRERVYGVAERELVWHDPDEDYEARGAL